MSKEQEALEAERASRADWGTVNEYSDGERIIRTQIEDAGYRVVAAENGYSVVIVGRQMSVYTLTANGSFKWGWVQNATGRTEYTDWARYLTALRRFTPTKEPKV